MATWTVESTIIKWECDVGTAFICACGATLLRGRIHKYSWYDEEDVELEVWGEKEEDGTWALMHCITEALSCKLVRPEVLLFDQRVVAAANVDEVHNDMCNGMCLLSFGI